MLQCDLLVQKEGKRMDHKFPLVTRFMSIYFSVVLTSRYYACDFYTFFFFVNKYVFVPGFIESTLGIVACKLSEFCEETFLVQLGSRIFDSVDGTLEG